MGECGCTSDKLGKVRGPDKVWYIVEFYAGCDNCGADLAVGVSIARDGTDDMDWYEDVPEIEFGRYGQWGRRVLDTGSAVERFREWLGDVGADLGDEDGYGSPGDALHDFLEGAGLRHAVFDTLYQSEVADAV